MGLLSDGGVHSHNSHLYGLLKMAKDAGLTKVYVHSFMDGRDVPPTSGKDSVEEIVSKMEEIGVGTVSYTHLDVDKRQVVCRTIFRIIRLHAAGGSEMIGRILKPTAGIIDRTLQEVPFRIACVQRRAV